MRNFRLLLVHELQSQMKSFTFAVMIPVAFIVSLFVTNMQLTSYKDRKQVYVEQQKQSNERLEKIYVYSQFAVDVYMPPPALSVFAMGLDENIGNKITVSVFDAPEISVTSQRSNAFIRIFNNIDISGVVKILSIFMILMAACPIAIERERQTGKLTFANSVTRLEYFLSKYAALMVVACIMITVIFIIPVIWMTFDPQIDLSLSAIGSILLMVVFSILYLSVFVLISLSVSVISSKVSMATVTGLMIWAMMVYVYPFTVNSIVDRLVKIPSNISIHEQITQIENDMLTELDEYMEEKPLPRCGSICGMSSAFWITTNLDFSTKECYEAYQSLNDYLLPKRQLVIDRIYAIKDDQKKQQLYKRKLYGQLAFFIPDNIYQNICEQIAGTDYDFREYQFMNAARNYRNVLMEYIRSKNGFGYAFFTQLPESEMRDSNNDYSQSIIEKYCEEENLDKIFTAEVPRFTFFRQSRSSATWMVLLTLLNVVFCGLSIPICNKYLSFK